MANIIGALDITSGQSSLKAIDGDLVFNDDMCMVATSDGFYFYQLESPSTATEELPKIVQPTNNGSTKRWILRSTRYFNENVEFDKDKYLKIREIKEKDTDGIIFTLTDGTEIARIDSTGLVVNNSLTLVDDNLNVNTLNNVPLTDLILKDGSISFTNQIKAPSPISDDDLTNKLWVEDAISSAVIPVDLSDYIKFNNSIVYSPTAPQQPANVKYVNDTIATSGMHKSVYDTNDDGVVDEADAITDQGSLATLSKITSGHINSESATLGQTLVADGSGNTKWGEASSGGGMSKLEKRPTDMVLDDTNTGTSFSSIWHMTNTLEFDTDSDGSCWMNFVLPDGFDTTDDILIDIFYSLSTLDNSKSITFKTDVWSTSTATSATSGSNEGSYTDTITSSSTNTDKYTKLTLPNGKIPNAAIGSTDDLITVKFSRLSTDTYSGY